MQVNNRYNVLNRLGQGGMGMVFRAHDRLTRQTVAFKRMLIDPFDKKAGGDTEATIRRLSLALANEFRVAASLRHPNIVDVLDYGFDQQRKPYFVMTLYSDIKDLLTYAKDKPKDEKYQLILQLLQALQYLHQRGIIHRDLKPDNVVVTADGTVKVLDFGLAIYRAETFDQSDARGTASYLAPELIHGKKPDVTSDLWVVGVMAYQMFMGNYPFKHDSVGNLLRSIVYDTPSLDGMDAQLGLWVNRLLSKDPRDRYRSAYDAMADLCLLIHHPLPPESQAIRNSFLEASQFVGREHELSVLREGLSVIQNQACRFYLLGGESGVGKSRLVDEVRTLALVDGVSVLRGQSFTVAGLPFQTWRPIIRELLLSLEVTPIEAGILKAVIPDIAEIVDIDVAEIAPLSDRAQQDRLIITILDLLKRIDHPTLIILEDIHWANESLVLLQQLLMVERQLSYLMVVATYRSDERPELTHLLSSMEQLTLERLSRNRVAELAQAILGDVGQDRELLDLLDKETEGNTYFIVEVLRSLAESAGRLDAIQYVDLPRQVLTGGMKAILTNRLGKIPAQYRPVLELSAVIGRQVDADLLAHLVPYTHITTWFYHAELAMVLTIQDGQWLFTHDKLRETLLEDLSPDEQARLHQQVATAIETIYPDNADYHDALLEHWHHARILDKELCYLEYVAKKLIHVAFDVKQADHVLGRALEQLDADDSRRAFILNWLADARRIQGDYEQAKNLTQQALTLAETHNLPQDKAQSLKSLGSIARTQGDVEQAQTYLHDSLAIYRQLDDRIGIANTLNNLANTYIVQGDLTQATILHEESLRIKRSLNLREEIAFSLNNLGYIAGIQHDHDKALKYYGECLDILSEVRKEDLYAMCMTNMGWSYLALEDKQAIEMFHRSLIIARERDMAPVQLENIIGFAKVDAQDGNPITATKLLGFVDGYQSVDAALKALYADLLPTLEDMLGTDDYQSIYDWGKTLTLDSVVNELLQSLD